MTEMFISNGIMIVTIVVLRSTHFSPFSLSLFFVTFATILQYTDNQAAAFDTWYYITPFISIFLQNSIHNVSGCSSNSNE